MPDDPLLQPYQLKHLTFKNRLMITSHEPAYPEAGMPKERYRAYHTERARAGVALIMTAGRETEQPHDITPADTRRKIVIVGTGPAGAESALVCAARGHEVIVREAANPPGGQIRLTAQTPRRAEMMQIIQWRMAECERMGVRLHHNSFVDMDTVPANRPDIVIIATGGLPYADVLTAGNDLTVSAWDILSGDVKPGENVLIYDDSGDYAGRQAAKKLPPQERVLKS